jgi:hypothetical protein
MSHIPKSNIKHHKGGHHEGTKDTKIFEPQRRKERKGFLLRRHKDDLMRREEVSFCFYTSTARPPLPARAPDSYQDRERLFFLEEDVVPARAPHPVHPDGRSGKKSTKMPIHKTIR